MAEPSKSVHWEQVSDSWWSSVLGYVMKEEAGVWVAHVYHNQRAGSGWTESKRGFRTAPAARRWVENRAEG